MRRPQFKIETTNFVAVTSRNVYLRGWCKKWIKNSSYLEQNGTINIKLWIYNEYIGMYEKIDERVSETSWLFI